MKAKLFLIGLALALLFSAQAFASVAPPNTEGTSPDKAIPALESVPDDPIPEGQGAEDLNPEGPKVDSQTPDNPDQGRVSTLSVKCLGNTCFAYFEIEQSKAAKKF